MEKMTVPYANLKRFYHRHRQEIDAALQDCLENSYFINGPRVKTFEKSLSRYLGSPAVGVSSGTSALLLCYEYLSLPVGSKVAVPSFTFMSTPEMLSKLGLIPVWIDCNMSDYTIDIDDLDRKMSHDIKAIVGVDLFGHTCDWDKVNAIAAHWNVPVIQDSAQSFGGRYKDQINGSYNLSIHSFYPAKNLFCLGDGGAVSGPQQAIDRIAMAKDHGRTDKYLHEFVGWNERLDAIHASVLDKMLPHINEFNSQRRRVAQLYDEHIKIDTKVCTADYCYNVYNQYTVRLEDRDRFRQSAVDNGVECGVMWPLGCHQQPAYASKETLINTEQVSQTIISLPCWPYMTDSEVSFVIDTVNRLLS